MAINSTEVAYGFGQLGSAYQSTNSQVRPPNEAWNYSGDTILS